MGHHICQEITVWSPMPSILSSIFPSIDGTQKKSSADDIFPAKNDSSTLVLTKKTFLSRPEFTLSSITGYLVPEMLGMPGKFLTKHTILMLSGTANCFTFTLAKSKDKVSIVFCMSFLNCM